MFLGSLINQIGGVIAALVEVFPGGYKLFQDGTDMDFQDGTQYEFQA